MRTGTREAVWDGPYVHVQPICIQAAHTCMGSLYKYGLPVRI